MAIPKFINDRYEGINLERMRNYRVNRAVEQMKKDGLGCLITWDAASIRYLTSVYVTIPMRWVESAAAVIFRDGEYYATEPHPGVWQAGEPDTPWLKDRGLPRLGPGKLATTVAQCDDLVKTVAKMMADHGVTNEPLGLDGCTSEFLLQEAFNQVGIKCVDGKRTMLEARKIKNQDEIECIRIACSMAEAAFADIRDAIRPGIRECDLVGIGMKRLYEEGADECQEFVCASGERTNPQRVDFTDRTIRAGDLLYIDINGCSFMGYKTCYYRTFCCGKPTAEQEEVYDLSRAMAEDMKAAIKAGATVEDLAAKLPCDTQVYHGHNPKYWGWDSWEAFGGYAWNGHGIGLALHELPIIGPGRTVKFEEGMVVALQQRSSFKDGKEGVRLEDNVAVTKDGCDLLTLWPMDKITECWT